MLLEIPVQTTEGPEFGGEKRMSSRAAETSTDVLPVDLIDSAPSISDLEGGTVIRCRNADGVTWYYDRDGDDVLLYHEWYGFEARSRSTLSARSVMSHPDVDAATVSRRQLETLSSGGEFDGE